MSANVPLGFRPLHDAHAIEQVVLSVQFESPLSDESVRQGVAALDKFASRLPAKHDLMGVGFSFGPSGLAPVMPPPSFDGQARYITNSAGVLLKELRLERRAMFFNSQEYTRWEALWSEVSEYFESLLSSIGPATIAGFSLQYVDKFIWEGSPASCRCTSLLKAGSAYVSPKTFESQDLWHCHTGRFDKITDQLQSLEVVDLDCIDEWEERPGVPAEQSRVVRISTTVSQRFNRPGFEAYQLPASESMPVASRAFDMLHTQLKRVFSEIISSEIAAKIGMSDDNQ